MHVRRGNESLRCLLESAKRSKGGLALAQEAVRQLPWRVAVTATVKLKLQDPKKSR